MKSAEIKPKPKEPKFSLISDYIVEKIVSRLQNVEKKMSLSASSDSSVMRLITKITKLSDEQKKMWKMKLNVYQIMKKQHDRIAYDIRLIDATIKTSA